MRTTLTTLVLLAILVLTGGVIIHSQNTPRTAIARIGEAIETRDPRLLDRHVDLEAVIAAAVDDLLAAAVASGDSTDSVRDTAFLTQARAVYTARLRNTLLDAFLPDSAGRGAAADSSAAEDDRGAARRIELLEVREADGSAHVSVRVEEPESGTALRLSLSPERRENTWTVVRVLNIADFADALDPIRHCAGRSGGR